MSLGIALLVLLAAVFHSSWNPIAKHVPNRLASATLIALVYLVAWAVGVVIFGFPGSDAWPFIIVSAVLQTAYLLLLTASYKHGDFSQICPLARGLAVLLVAIVSVTLLAEHLSRVQLAGVAVMGGSLLGLALIGKGGSHKGVFFAVLTGDCIAAYSIVDGVGVRESGNAFGYISWLFLLQGISIPVVCWLCAANRGGYVRAVGRD